LSFLKRNGAVGGNRYHSGFLEDEFLQVKVVNQQVDQALKVLKRQLLKDGLWKELKKRRSYEKPSAKRKRKQKEAEKKRRKAQRIFA
jgi:small subunit ribosomal protein S21